MRPRGSAQDDRAAASPVECLCQKERRQAEPAPDLCSSFRLSDSNETSFLIGRNGDSQDRFAAYVLQRPVNMMGARIDGNGVRVSGKEAFEYLLQTTIALVKDRDV